MVIITLLNSMEITDPMGTGPAAYGWRPTPAAAGPTPTRTRPPRPGRSEHPPAGGWGCLPDNHPTRQWLWPKHAASFPDLARSPTIFLFLSEGYRTNCSC